MNTLRTLHDAFSALEERADATALHSDYAAPERPPRPRLAPPLAAAAAVLAVAAGVAAWQASRDGHPARVPAAGGSSRASTSAAYPVARFRPPSTVNGLTAKARSILGDTATITIDPKRSSACGAALATAPTPTPTRTSVAATLPRGTYKPPLPKPAGQAECSGAAIVGTLTSAGMTGGFDLGVYRASPGDAPICDAKATCTPRTLPDGSRLTTSTWHDSEVPGGMTYKVNLIRPDGGEILFHLSTEHDPKGASVVTASHVPLTIAQLTAFVTSDRW
jgi:ferric-dicitrate binding protein FerR (iron transport regulator)